MMRFWTYILTLVILTSCGQELSRFQLISSMESGIDFNNSIVENDSFNILNNEYMYNGGGVGIGDLNADGLQDIVFTGNKVTSRIYLNQGDFRFEDITANFDGLSNDQWYSGVAIADVNGDGREDVYLTSTMSDDSLQRRNALWINQGAEGNGPVFRELAAKYGIDDPGYSVHAGFFDYDLDGDLDLYVLNNIVNQQIPTNYRPKIVDGSSINNDQLYRNDGGSGFTNVTVQAGIVYEGFGLGMAFGDINKDNYPDIYISNDYISNDLLYINQGNGTFKNSSEAFLSYHSKFSMGNDISDYNNDGNPDIITLDMLPEKYFRKKQTINGNSYIFYVNDRKYGYEHQYVRNMVHTHNGFQGDKMLPFSEMGQMMGVHQTEWSWSPLFADFDNDGDRDLFITNGFPKDLTDKDFTNYKAQMLGYLATEEQVIAKIPVVKVSNYAYEQTDLYEFSDVTKNWGLKIPSFSNGAAFADLDNDGDLDYVVNNINDEAFLYRNNTMENANGDRRYLRLKLIGPDLNTNAIGARIKIQQGGKTQYYEHFLARGYISSVDPVVHFGLPDGGLLEEVEVIWPGGTLQTVLKDVEPGQTLTLDVKEASAIVPEDEKEEGQWLFEEAEGQITYTHKETDFIDFFQYQHIIPHKYSQIGPCMSKGDLNNDGLDDLLIGATTDLPTTAYLRTAEGFTQGELPGLTEQKSCQESDMIIADLDLDGDNDIIALAGGYVANEESGYKHYVYVNQNGRYEQQEIPIPSFPAGVVRPLDYDNDGDMDFFIGARVKKSAFPFAPQSYLLKNDKGSLSPDQEFDLGMVTDAVVTDYNGDGFRDILVAREWNTLTMLENDAGESFKTSGHPSLSTKHGLWSGLAVGDFDQDGDDDYIAGNLGQNHRFTVHEKFPMRIYAMDVDKNGTIDPVTTAYWEDKEGVMQEYPINFYDELVAQSPFFRKKYVNYTDFSYATINDFFNTDSISNDLKFQVNTTQSFVLWNEDGTMRWEPLDKQLQVAPIKEMLVLDLNEDGLPDVLITGNDYTYDVSTGYYDANKGMIMMGSAGGTFEVLTPAESGLLLDGQVEEVLYFEGETPYLVAGINRDKLAVFKHNRP